jgi:hypothetical protein
MSYQTLQHETAELRLFSSKIAVLPRSRPVLRARTRTRPALPLRYLTGSAGHIASNRRTTHWSSVPGLVPDTMRASEPYQRTTLRRGSYYSRRRGGCRAGTTHASPLNPLSPTRSEQRVPLPYDRVGQTYRRLLRKPLLRYLSRRGTPGTPYSLQLHSTRGRSSTLSWATLSSI